jgi:hypothetical protein
MESHQAIPQGEASRGRTESTISSAFPRGKKGMQISVRMP